MYLQHFWCASFIESVSVSDVKDFMWFFLICHWSQKWRYIIYWISWRIEVSWMATGAFQYGTKNSPIPILFGQFPKIIHLDHIKHTSMITLLQYLDLQEQGSLWEQHANYTLPDLTKVEVTIGRKKERKLTLNLSMATDASDRDLTENGVTFKAKVMALKTVTTVNAWKKEMKRSQCMRTLILCYTRHLQTSNVTLPVQQ